jgi:hypothetical protein
MPPRTCSTSSQRPTRRAPQVINADVPQRDYWQVVLGSAAVTQQFCTVAAAVATPVHLRHGRFSAQGVLQLCAVLLLAGYTVCCIVGGHILGGSLVSSRTC